jgi:hypothetical protein
LNWTDHSSAVFFRKSVSFVRVAILALQVYNLSHNKRWSFPFWLFFLDYNSYLVNKYGIIQLILLILFKFYFTKIKKTKTSNGACDIPFFRDHNSIHNKSSKHITTIGNNIKYNT